MRYIILEKSKEELEDKEKDKEEKPEEQTESKVDVGHVVLVPGTKKKAEVTAVGKDGVTARDDKGNRFQMVHENVKTKDGKEPKEEEKPEENEKPEKPEEKDGDSIDSKLPKEKKEGKKPPKEKDEKEEEKEDGKSTNQKIKEPLDSKLKKKKDKKKDNEKEIEKAEYYTTIDEEFEKARTQGAKDKQKRRARATSTELDRKDLESENWHTRTMARMRGLPAESLHFIIKDATEAAENAEHMGNPKAGQYRDEVHYAHMELRRRIFRGIEKSYVVSIDEEFEKARK